LHIEGKPHIVSFFQKRTRYELYVDGLMVAHLIQSPDAENQEKAVRIDGKDCQFVLYGDQPDLVVDGIMKCEEMREYQNQKFHRNVLIGLGFVQVIVGTFCGLIWSILQLSEVYSVGGFMGLVFSIAFTLSGVAEVLLGLRKSRKLKEYAP
jgi:hypothetical protein